MTYGQLTALLLVAAIILVAGFAIYASDPEGRGVTQAGVCFVATVVVVVAWICFSIAKLMGVYPW